MYRTIEFSKLSASGNDFVCIDNRDGRFDDILGLPEHTAHFARTLCHRGTGIGADGLVFAMRPEIAGVAEVAARYLEADGTETALCGNGTACFLRWAVVRKIVSDGDVRILASAGVVVSRDLDDGYVRVCIPLPEDIERDLELDVDGQKVRCDHIVTGIEHVVVFVDDITRADVARLGPALRHHEHFPQPRGVNVNFVQMLGEGEIALRTYEYGVESETLACGTGSAAAAVLSVGRFGWPANYAFGDKPVLVRARGGDVLRVCITADDDGTVTDLCLETLVRRSYSGEVSPDLAQLALGPPNA